MRAGKQRTRNPRLFSVLFTIGGILLGAALGVLVAAALYTYLIPFWQHTEIDVEGRNFREIVLVDPLIVENSGLSQDNVILKTEDGDYYSYHQAEWKLTEPPEVDLARFPYSYPSCDEWRSPPPAVYLQRVKDSVGVEFEHTIGINSRCYVLLEDGSLDVWTREYDVFHMLYIGAGGLVTGMIVGGIIGKSVAKKKHRHNNGFQQRPSNG